MISETKFRVETPYGVTISEIFHFQKHAPVMLKRLAKKNFPYLNVKYVTSVTKDMLKWGCYVLGPYLKLCEMYFRTVCVKWSLLHQLLLLFASENMSPLFDCPCKHPKICKHGCCCCCCCCCPSKHPKICKHGCCCCFCCCCCCPCKHSKICNHGTQSSLWLP